MSLPSSHNGLPPGLLIPFRGVGQIIFQGHALTGLLFVLGVAAGSPLMAAGLLAGSVIGCGVAWVLKFDRSEVVDGIHGFNPSLVGIATLFFFAWNLTTILLLVLGCVAATLVTVAARKFVPCPTYTAPFIVTTWVVFFLGKSIGAIPAGPGYGPILPDLPAGPVLESVFHGVSQVMFQASVWTAIFFVAGIALSNRQHAGWVVFGSLVGALVAVYHIDAADRTLDPEQTLNAVR
jgi:urea transporter